MSLRNSTIPNESRLEAVHELIGIESKAARATGSLIRQRRFAVLKSIAAELGARMAPAENRALHQVGAQMLKVLTSPAPPNYDRDQLVRLAQTVIHHWPEIRQALESFQQGEAKP